MRRGKAKQRGLNWAVLVFLASALVVRADETVVSSDYLVKIWGVDEGMPVASVADVAQTPDGYLWVATMGGGLLRFDGTRFVSFLGVKNTVPKLFVDCEGKLWVCRQSEGIHDRDLITWTHNGFDVAGTNLGDPERLLWSAPGQVVFLNSDRRILWGTTQKDAWHWKFITLTNVSAKPTVCADGEGRIWYLTRDRKLWTWQQGQFNQFTTVPGLEGQQLTALVADKQGRVWAGTDQSLSCWQAGRFVNMTPTNGEAKLVVKRIFPAGNSGLWVEANNLMRRCEGRNWVAESKAWMRELGRSSTLNFVQVGPWDDLWTGRKGLGIINLEPNGALQKITTRDGLASDNVPFVLPDQEGNIWTGFLRGELAQVYPRLFSVLDSRNGLRDTLVTTVCEDKDGAIWMGTVGGTVSRYRDGQCTNFTLEGDVNLQNSSVACDARGRIWVGTYNSGLYCFENDRFRLVLDHKQLGVDIRELFIRQLFPARDGQLWIGTRTSVFLLGDDGIKNVSSDLVSRANPYAFAQTSDGTIWLGTLGGDLLRWDGNQFERVEIAKAGNLGRIWSLWPTPDGGLWIGTARGGLLYWHEGKIQHYTTSDGLPSNAIMQLLTDEDGNVWLATSVGLVRIAKQEFSRYNSGEIPALPCSIYGRGDGLQTVAAMADFQPNCWRARDGTLWFAMVKGVAFVRPEHARPNPLPPVETIEEVRANGRSVWPTNEGVIIASRPGAKASEAVVTVGPGRSDLEIRYAGMSLTSPQNLQFKCRLGNLDQGWIEQGNSRVVVYRNVPPGEHDFEVVACSRDGVWNDRPANIKIIVLPHFYERNDFIILMVLIAVAGLVLGVRQVFRRRMLKRLDEAKRRHALELERGRIARDLHDDLGAGLTEISLIGSLAQRPGREEPQMRQYLRHITDKAKEMFLSLDEIVWALNPKNDSVLALDKYFREYAQLFLQAIPLACRLERPNELSDCPLSSEQRQHLLMGFKEALNNIARHAQATEVRVLIATKAQRLIIEVIDNGQGLPENPPASGADGLDNMSSRLKSLGGSCQIQSRPGAGTCVRFELPLNLKAENENHRKR